VFGAVLLGPMTAVHAIDIADLTTLSDQLRRQLLETKGRCSMKASRVLDSSLVCMFAEQLEKQASHSRQLELAAK